MKLYTIIAEWKGGTYTSQVEAEDEIRAIFKWLAQLDDFPIPGFGPVTRRLKKQEVESDLQGDDKPVLLKGLANVWFWSFLVRNSLMMLSIVCTRKPEDAT